MESVPAKNSVESEYRIKQLFVYPIKGCAGVEVSAIQALSSGLTGDRAYMLVTEVTESCCTSIARVNPYELPCMAWILPELPREDGIWVTVLKDGKNENRKFIPLLETPDSLKTFPYHGRWIVEAYDQGDDASNFISAFLRE